MIIIQGSGVHRIPMCPNVKQELTTQEKTIPRESLVRIFIGGEFFSSLLCTPEHLPELVAGWLFNQGLIESVDAIASMGTCDNLKDVSVSLTTNRYKERHLDHLVRTSGCMAGEIPYSQFFASSEKMIGGPEVTMADIKILMKQALSMASTYREAGGIHCAAIASVTGKGVIACFEDVGRHNAVDKVTGRMLLTRQSPENLILLTSGRLSSEMVLKTARIRIPILASITTGTDLAVSMAEQAGLTIVGRTLGANPVVWCGGHRIAQ